MDWIESYNSGLSANLAEVTIQPPEWLRQLEWSDLGLWITAELSDVKASLPELDIYSARGNPARMEILEMFDYPIQAKQAYRKLEDEGFPLIALDVEKFITCDRVLVTRGYDGSTDLVGQFKLVTGSPKNPGKLSYNLPRRLTLVDAPGTCENKQRLVTFDNFRVPVKVTGNRNVVMTSGPQGSLPDWLGMVEPKPKGPVTRSKSVGRLSFFKY